MNIYSFYIEKHLNKFSDIYKINNDNIHNELIRMNYSIYEYRIL
jgi:hypothetical protein